MNLRTQSVTGNGTSLKTTRRTVVIVSGLQITGTASLAGPRTEDLRSAKYPLIIQPYITAQDVGSTIHALERGHAPTQKHYSPYTPIRFVPSEKISRHHKLMLAFDAFVIWKASGQMPI